VKVIYDHSRRLSEIGIASAVQHDRRGYEYPWIDHAAQLISDKELRTTDHLVLPEIKAAQLARKLTPLGVRYSIFVQNGYYLRDRDKDCCDADVDHAYENASTILSISDDTSALISLHYPQLAARVTRVFCSVNQQLFNPEGVKRNLITYMPRKNGVHAAAVVFALRNRLPADWEIRAIEGMSEIQVAELLKQSRIFLSFSGLEGLGLPPIEAAMSGNYVIGYHGGGGREYWSAPNFEAVDVGDIGAFARNVEARVKLLSCRSTDLCELESGMATLRKQFSIENERASLRCFADSVSGLHAQSHPHGGGGETVPILLQKRMRLGTWLKLRGFRNRASGRSS
jgi:hypothetical protein